MRLQWVPSAMQQADLFTKPLDAPTFVRLRTALMGEQACSIEVQGQPEAYPGSKSEAAAEHLSPRAPKQVAAKTSTGETRSDGASSCMHVHGDSMSLLCASTHPCEVRSDAGGAAGDDAIIHTLKSKNQSPPIHHRHKTPSPSPRCGSGVSTYQSQQSEATVIG